MKTNKERCIFCMEEMEEGQERCPSCGKIAWEYEWKKRYLLPRTILKDKYFLGVVLGSGNFGITYLAYDMVLDTKIAIKEFFPRQMVKRSKDARTIETLEEADEGFQKELAAFKKEAEVIFGSFDVMGICSVKDYFEENNTAYIVEEYLAGGTLKDYLKRQQGQVLSTSVMQELFAPVLEGLGILHSKGVIHRDISPDNLMFDQEGNLKLIDFGAARQGAEGELLLKEDYAPPELYQQQGHIGPWTDIYEISAVIYQVLTGKKPVASTKRMKKDTLEKAAEIAAVPDSVSEALNQGMSLDIQKRYFYVGNLMERLEIDGSHAAVLLGKTRHTWGEEWMKIVTEESTTLTEKSKRGMTKRMKKKILMSAAGVIVFAGICSLGVYGYCKMHPTEVFDYRLRQAQEEVKSHPDCPVINKESENYEEIKKIAKEQGKKSDAGGKYFTRYIVSEEVVKEHKLLSNQYPKFYLDYKCTKKICEYYFDTTFGEDNSSFLGFIDLDKDKGHSITLWNSRTVEYKEAGKDGSRSVKIAYDPMDERVQKIEIIGQRADAEEFLKEIFPYMVPETYLTEKEIADILEKLETDPATWISLNNHAKYMMTVHNQMDLKDNVTGVVVSLQSNHSFF